MSVAEHTYRQIGDDDPGLRWDRLHGVATVQQLDPAET
jgi:hypothetical protein